MSDIEARALALLNACGGDVPMVVRNKNPWDEALCRAIEQHEAFKREVSDAVVCYFNGVALDTRLHRFIIPKPKPDLLEQALKNMDVVMERLEAFRAELVTLELEIREKGQ